MNVFDADAPATTALSLSLPLSPSLALPLPLSPLSLATAASVLLLPATAAAAASAASARNCCFDPVKRSCRLFSTPLNGIQCFGYCVAAGLMQKHECRGMPFFHASTNNG